MIFFLTKIIVSGVVIAVVSSLAKTFPKWAALLTALPSITFLSLIWIYWETKDLQLLANYTKDVLMWVLPSLFFFAAAIPLFRAGVSFVMTMFLSAAALGIGVVLFRVVGLLKL